MEKAIKQEKRKMKRKSLVKFSTDFLPIDMVHDPSGFVDKLFSKLRSTNERYEVKLYLLRIISRMIGRHKIQLLQFYPFLLRYLSSHSKDRISEIFAMIIESCHELVPPEAIRPIIEKITSNFISEFCNNQHITVGLNCIREILLRMPLALTPNQVEYLCLFKSNRNKSVAAAAKSLVNYFRDVCPELLPNRKLQGRFTKVDDTNRLENIEFGQERAARGVEGIELLAEYERQKGRTVDLDRILTDEELKKIKILRLKEGVRRVDRHGFALGGKPDTEEIDYEKMAAEMEVGKSREEYLAKVMELEKLRAMARELEDAQSWADDEMGESEVDEPDNMADEESEDSYVEEEADEQGEEEDDSEEVPEAVPIATPGINQERPAEQDDISVSDINVSSSSSSEYDSDILDPDSNVNPHGFMYSNMIDTYQKSKRERLDDLRIEKAATHEDHRQRFKHKGNKGGGNGKTNKVHAKNKPFMMVRKKKIQKLHDSLKTLNAKKQRDKRQLGHFRKATK